MRPAANGWRLPRFSHDDRSHSRRRAYRPGGIRHRACGPHSYMVTNMDRDLEHEVGKCLQILQSSVAHVLVIASEEPMRRRMIEEGAVEDIALYMSQLAYALLLLEKR